MLTKEELLKEAKLRYPIGSIVRSEDPSYLHVEMKIRDHKDYVYDTDRIYFYGDKHNEESLCPAVYYSGRWAEIVNLNYEIC